ncbi:tail completion protein gp17 [Neorhizobium petrolearium]|uniref:DUF3168 domain-containing protein n=1 Tax=Neorhizobium petrolearium TaxID=515361 RepID=A0ABY8M4M8_9HYPH|nr:DUF3168 domain-containing protein [Neorhizobium petrolearium]MCC2608388.1 DUF3168 domain-containing protein [Neorhizobium petrolearium]WGI68666.1 DUF3168 domain-containing protein [Neorhizobium petrolearium]
MEEAVTALLTADARVRYLMGDRIHWGRLPQKAQPGAYVILQVISSQIDHVNSGRSGLERVRLQVDGYADRFLTARDCADAATDILEKYRGKISGVTFQGGLIESRRDFQPDGAAGKQLFRRSTDIFLWYSS